MITLLVVAGVLILAVQAVIGLGFLISCLWEKEPRASVAAMLQFLSMALLLIVFSVLGARGVFHSSGGLMVLLATYVLAGFVVWLLLRHSGANPAALAGTNGLTKSAVKRWDEREIVFARNRSLPVDSPQYEQFYRDHPELKDYDDKRRQMGGPLGKMGTVDGTDGHANLAAMTASMSIPLALSDPRLVSPQRNPFMQHKVGDDILTLPEAEATQRVKGYAKRLGACLVGVAKIDPHWIYSRRGEIFRDNWEDWGAEIELNHTYAIVIAEEMDFEIVGTAPHTPTAVESMFNYAKGAFISTQLAAFIANLGYDATANHLRHYDLILPPLAVDAGLGELSRMGYLLTKEYGPRVRLSAVSTNLPLICDRPVDIGVEHFCRICKKCATCCPSKSIPSDDQKIVNGTLRWKLNAETCFEYWGKVGTDCNVCMSVCPWSHARTWPHRLIVAMITRNALARRLFNWMDDLFYGRRPKPKPGPAWLKYTP